MSSKPTANAEAIIGLIAGSDKRTGSIGAGFDIELAVQKMLFFTAPAEFLSDLEAVISASDANPRSISFLLGVGESLESPVELSYNLCNESLFAQAALSAEDIDSARAMAAEALGKWARNKPAAFAEAAGSIKQQDSAANGGANPFAWRGDSFAKRKRRDPYASPDDYLACFGPLYRRGMYYTELFFARSSGLTDCRFINEGGTLTDRCRRMGCLGATVSSASDPAATDSIIALRSVFLLTGEGLVLTADGTGAPDMSAVDEVLLDGADAAHKGCAKQRIGVPNTRSIVACSPDVRGICDAVLAARESLSVVSVPLSELSKDIRRYRVKTLVGLVPETSRFREIDAETVQSMRDDPINAIEFMKQLEEVGVKLVPGDEEDAVSHAEILCIKRAAALLKKEHGIERPPIMTSDMAFYIQSIDLLGIAYCADSPALQQALVRMSPLDVDEWDSLYEGLDDNGEPFEKTTWAKRAAILAEIWPEWGRLWGASDGGGER